MSLDSKIHMIIICDYDTLVTNHVYTRKCDQFRIYNQWNMYIM